MLDALVAAASQINIYIVGRSFFGFLPQKPFGHKLVFRTFPYTAIRLSLRGSIILNEIL